MGRVGFLGPTALLPVAAGLALGACGGGSGDGLPPVDMQTGLVASSPRSFRAAASHDVGADPWDLTAADLTADGVTDLVVATPRGDQVWLLPQDPSRRGSFLPARGFATPRAPYQAAAADLNGDERIDLLHASSSNDPALAGVYLSLQDVTVPGTFRPAVKLAAGQKPAHVSVGDLDGDGRLDLVVANDGINTKGSGITVLLADPAGPGQFGPGVFHGMGDIAQMSCIAAFDGDDRPDLAVAAMVPGLVNDYESFVQLFLQDPARPGHFVRGGRYDSGDLADFIAVADLDGDGLSDVVTGESPQVLYNDPAQPGTLPAARLL